MQHLRSWLKHERGSVAIWFAIGSLAIAGLGAGALTMTRLTTSANRLQDLADGAALAAAVEAGDPAADQARIEDAAQRFDGEARRGRGMDDPAAMTVTLTEGRPRQVTVTLAQDVPTILAGLVGRDSIAIRKRATAVASKERRVCLHVLDPNAADALKLQGNPDLSAPDCTVQVNSAVTGGLFSWGSPSAAVEAAYVAGPAGNRLRGWSPEPRFNQPSRPDPFAGRVTWPAPVPEDRCIRLTGHEPVLRPGFYCDGLQIGRAGQDGSRMEPGVYVVQSGGVTVKGRGSFGRGVAIVMLDPAGEFNIDGGSSSLSITAPTEGAWAGIAIAAKPGGHMPSSVFHGNLSLQGAMYLPGHHLTLLGSPELGGSGDDRTLIVRRLTLQGAPNMSLAGGYPSGVYGQVRLIR